MSYQSVVSAEAAPIMSPSLYPEAELVLQERCEACGAEFEAALSAIGDFCEECVTHGHLDPSWALWDDLGVGD